MTTSTPSKGEDVLHHLLSTLRGTTSQPILRRLARDAPDAFERVQ
jgi:hypothetical protein